MVEIYAVKIYSGDQHINILSPAQKIKQLIIFLQILTSTPKL